MTRTRRRTAPAAAALALPALLLTGCGFQGAQSFPLPGGEGITQKKTPPSCLGGVFKLLGSQLA